MRQHAHRSYCTCHARQSGVMISDSTIRVSYPGIDCQDIKFEIRLCHGYHRASLSFFIARISTCAMRFTDGLSSHIHGNIFLYCWLHPQIQPTRQTVSNGRSSYSCRIMHNRPQHIGYAHQRHQQFIVGLCIILPTSIMRDNCL